LLKIEVPEGTTVQAGVVLAWIGEPGEILAAGERAAPTNGQAQVHAVEVRSGNSASQRRELGFISPVVARLAREYNLDLTQVKGSGEGGRITKKDVMAYLGMSATGQTAQVTPPEAGRTEIWETPSDGDLFRPTEMIFAERPPVAASLPTEPIPSEQGIAKPGASALNGTIVPLTTLRKAIAEHMVLSRHTSPHVTSVMEADLNRVMAHRAANLASFKEGGVDLTYTAYFIAAVVAGLKAFPLVNSSWREEGILVHHPINVGMAVALENEGLIVPVIKGADGLSLLGLARAVNDLAGRARAHRLQPDEVREGTFTLTNHGVSGSLFATPIINQPQCGILGTGAIQKRVVVINDAIAIRPMMYLTLTFDHRILDGAIADHFLAKVVGTLENWQ
jgi:2-oxoglutarate dehydrogenase E2 component (dihydrolipoamide succinyltransferase)